VYIVDTTGKEVCSGRANPNTGIFDTDCKLPCPGRYKVVPKNDKCKFSPEAIEVTMSERMCCDYINVVEFKCDCEQEQKYGRIQVKMPKECLEGTIVYIVDATGKEVWSGRANPNTGIFDTDCKLPCPGVYRVVPKNEKCKFSPETAPVNMSERMCCDYINVVEFKCDCEQEQKYGRIQVSMPRECWEGTTINIHRGSGGNMTRSPILTGRIDPKTGLFDTDCKLPCPGVYTVIAKNEKCKFSPEQIIVTMTERTCCDYIHKVEFKCDCKEEQGRIVISVSSRVCIQDTVMQIYEGEMMPGRRPVLTLKANNQGVFDTDCVLKCNTSYTIVPINDNCKFKPESKVVKVSCCPEVSRTEFDCDCEAPGSLIEEQFQHNSSWFSKLISFFAKIFHVVA
jgi:hypothetical protein